MRAIILAAGMGTRLRPLTSDKPKALVLVNGVPMIERQIEFLHKKNIRDITVVTGYFHKKFEYLTNKYGVELVFNDKYEIYNNLYTMYLVRHLLPDSYILEGDIYMNKNIFESSPSTSTYFCAFRSSFQNEWRVVVNEQNRVLDIDVCDGENDYILSGVSYWDEKDGNTIRNKIEEAMNSAGFENLFWDDIVRTQLFQLNVKLNKLNETDLFEIDSVEDHATVESMLKSL